MHRPEYKFRIGRELIMNWILRFCAYSCWVVPLYFYAWIPVVLEKSPIHHGIVLAVAALSFVFVWFAKWGFYNAQSQRKSRFTFDLIFMLMGLAILYCAKLNLLGNGNQNNDFLFICCCLTNIPSVLSVKDMRPKPNT